MEFCCVPSLALNYSVKVLNDHLKIKFHEVRYTTAEPILVKSNSWPLSDGVWFIHNSSDQVKELPDDNRIRNVDLVIHLLLHEGDIGSSIPEISLIITLVLLTFCIPKSGCYLERAATRICEILGKDGAAVKNAKMRRLVWLSRYLNGVVIQLFYIYLSLSLLFQMDDYLNTITEARRAWVDNCGCSRLLDKLEVSISVSMCNSDHIFESQELPGRTLLQQKSSCGVDFENQNYTIITSQCKGPNYQAKQCCGALKELACPFADQLNDMKNDCATTLFSYINLYGKYPPGLFANLCHDDKQGLKCDEVMEAKSKQQKSSAASHKSMGFLALTISTASFLILLFNLF